MLAAIEVQRLALDDVESARSFLSSTDGAEIDGLERDLLTSGKYIGQAELVHLLRDWTAHAPGTSCVLDKSGKHLTLRGSAALETHLRGVQAAGERSRGEIDHLAKALLDERDIVLCLDQEHARITGHSLLSATHPLVRAALRVPGSSQARFSSVRLVTGDQPAGAFLVLVSIARWTGLRPSVEFWTQAVDLESGAIASHDVGALLLAGLAEAAIEPGHSSNWDDLSQPLRTAERAMRGRHDEEQSSRQALNEALMETRRISLRETHARKVAQIDRRIRTLRERGNLSVLHLQEAQRANQDRVLREAEFRLEDARSGAMELEAVAVCVVEVAKK